MQETSWPETPCLLRIACEGEQARRSRERERRGRCCWRRSAERANVQPSRRTSEKLYSAVLQLTSPHRRSPCRAPQQCEATRRASKPFSLSFLPLARFALLGDDNQHEMKSAQSSPTKLKANAIPFPAPSQLSSPSPQGEEAQSPPVELKYQREEDTELFAPTSVQSSTPSTAQQQPGAGNKGERFS